MQQVASGCGEEREREREREDVCKKREFRAPSVVLVLNGRDLPSVRSAAPRFFYFFAVYGGFR